MMSRTELLTPASLPISIGIANNFWYVTNDSDTVVIFVHGVFSSSRTCWLFEDPATKRKVFWPDLVRTDDRLGAPSIFLADYHTSLDSGDYTLTECATELRDALRMHRLDHSRAPYDYARLVFICHSTGGIVVRYVLNRYKSEFKDKHVGLALMASPSLGSGWADLFRLAAKYYNQILGSQLSWDDSALQDLHWQFSELVDNRDREMPGLFGREAAEHFMIGRRILPRIAQWLVPPRRKVVQKLSAAQYFGQVRQIANSDHFSIVKPDSRDHPSHQFLIGFMTDFNRTAASRALSSGTDLSEDQRTALSAAANTAPPRSVTPGLSLDADEWPTATHDLVHFFVAEAGFDSDAEPGVVACVVVDEMTTLERRWLTAVRAMSEDPHLRHDPAIVQALRRQQYAYAETVPALREMISESLRSLTFEAYVAFARQGQTGDQTYSALLRAIIFDRLRAYRTRSISISVEAASDRRRVDASSAIRASAIEVRQRHSEALSLPRVETAPPSCPGPIVARYVAEIVRDRVSRGPAATAFHFVYPTKVRVIYEQESGRYYSRRNPFPG